MPSLVLRQPILLVALLLIGCDAGPKREADIDAPVAQPTGQDDAGKVSDAIAASVPPPPAVASELRAALERLVSGAGGDTATWFSAQTAGVLRSVEVDSAGHAIVDFVDLRPIIPNASSSAGSALLLSQVNAAVFATPGVVSVEYRMNGSCELLGEWLQYGVCLRFDRPQA